MMILLYTFPSPSCFSWLDKKAFRCHMRLQPQGHKASWPASLPFSCHCHILIHNTYTYNIAHIHTTYMAIRCITYYILLIILLYHIHTYIRYIWEWYIHIHIHIIANIAIATAAAFRYAGYTRYAARQIRLPYAWLNGVAAEGPSAIAQAPPPLLTSTSPSYCLAAPPLPLPATPPLSATAIRRC